MAGPFDFTSQSIETTYQRVLQTPDGINIYDGTGSLFTVTAVAAPAGPSQSIQFNDDGVTSGSGNFTFDKINNIVNLTGSLIATSFTGSLQGTASWADSASQAVSASYYQETDPIFTAKSASLATTGSNTFVGNQVVSGSFIIETASSAAALRITQLGAGEAIRVEDNTTPDSTAFIVDSSGSVGIGLFTSSLTLAAPLYPLHVIAPSGVDARMVFDGKQLGNGAANTNITIAADTNDKVASFDFLDRNGVAYNGTATYTGPTVKFLLDRSGSSTPLATGNRRNDFHIINGFADRSIIFYTSASDGNTSATVAGKPRLTITGSNVGIGTTTPLYKLDVSGSARVTNSLIVTGSTTSTLGFTGSLLGTSSWADSASQALTASYSTTASYALNGGVTQIQAGPGISLSPTNGLGVVEITSTAGSYNTATGSYGSFYDTGSYTATSTTTVYSMSLSTTDISNGVYVSGSDRTRIYVTNAGIYNLQFSAQFRNTHNNEDEGVAVWLRKNDGSSANDIVDSNSFITVPGAKGGSPGETIAAWNFFLELAANDFVQLLWHAEAANYITLETIAAGTNPVHPRTPSLIATVQRIDTFLSNTGSFSGSFIGTHTGSFTGSFTGSLLGTASWADSASQALTASFAPNYVLISDTSSMLQPYVLTSTTSSMLQPYVLTSITSSMLQPYVLTNVTSSMLQPYVLTSQTSSMTVGTASFVTGSNVVGNITGNASNITAFTINQNLGTISQVTFGGVTASLQGTATNANKVYINDPGAGIYGIPVHPISDPDYLNLYSAAGTYDADNAVFNFNEIKVDTLRATGSLLGTASYATQALTASYAMNGGGGGGGGGTNLGLVYAISLGYLMP